MVLAIVCDLFRTILLDRSGNPLLSFPESGELPMQSCAIEEN
jgi:hypothetical protein